MQHTNTTHFTTSTSPPYPTQLSEFTQPEGTYEGELKDNLKEGLGIFIWQNGDVYFGQWASNKMHGKGIFCFNTGHYIEGIFLNGCVNGPACLIYPDGSFVKGVFMNGELQGRVIYYQADKDIWFLQTFEAGKLTGTHYEGNGKPMTYDFCVNIYQEDLQEFSTRSVDSNYRIKSVQKESAISDSLGCFEIDAETRHFGVVKNNRISGLGLRINGKAIETGKYKDGNLEGFGRKLEFGSILYEGEFAHGKPNGKGALYQWKNKTLTVAVFTCGILVQKIEERAFSLLDLSQLSRAHIHNGDSEILKFAVRSYEDTFTKSYNRTNKKNEDPNGITTTIKEVEYAKVIARETIIEHKHNKSVTHGILQIPENHNIIKHKRSHSSDSVELPFSQAFSVHVNNKQPISNKNHRSVSRDSLRPKNTPNDFIRNKTNYNNQSLKEPPTSLANNSFSNANKARSTEVSSPSAIPTFGRADEKDYPSVGDLSPQMFNSLSSVQGVSQVSSANPFSAGSYLNFMISSPPSAIEKNPKKYNSQMDLTSNGSSIVSKKETTPTLHYQQKKLNKDRKASKSISGFQSPTQIPFDVKQGHNVNSISPYTYGMFGNLERSPSTSIFSHKHTLSSVQSPSDLQARDWVAMRSPSSAGLNSSTSAKKLKTGESPNKTANKGNKVLNQILTKKGSGSTSSASISFIKKADASDKGLSNTDKQPSLVYVGSTVYTKKPNVLSNKTKDVSPLNRTGSSFVSGKKDTASKPNKREPSLNGIRSPRMNKLMQVQSPTNFGNTTLQNCSVQEKLLSQKKGDSQGSYKLLVPDRSNTPVRNALTANLSPRISAFTLDVADTKQAAPKTSRESYYTNEEKLGTRSKSPMITNVDLTMYRSKTPGGISDLDDQRTSTGHPVFGRDPSPLSYRDSASPFGNYNEQDVNQSSTIKLNQEMAMQAARFSFLPAREDQYRSITSKDGQSVDGKFDSLLPDFANKEMSREKIMSPNTSIIESQVVHKRSASQADITQYEKEKQKILNNRYKYQDHRVIDSTIPSRKLTIDTHGSSSPDIFRSNSPYKIDAHQERINSRSKSPQRDKQGANSPHTPGSPCRHTHDSIDSHSSYYPVKKTCDPKLDPYYNEFRQSGCSRKGSSHRGSPLRKSQDLNIVNQGSVSSPSLQKEQDQPKESVSNNENLQREAKISITDIFRKSLNLVQSRAENSIDDAHFDLKALPTVCSRYDNFSDSRVYQRFPTKSSHKQTENSPERQSMTPHKILALRKDSSNQKSIIQKELEREPISEFIAEVTASPSSREDSEPDLGKRIESCLAQTRANIQIIETMDRDNEETQITGVKRPKSNESKSNNLKNIMGVNKSQGSSSSCNKNEFNSKISLRDLKQNLMLENKDLGPQSNRMSTNRTMSSARLKEGQNTKGKEGIEENRGAFTFREEKGAEAVTDQLLDEMVNERKNKVAKDFKRSNSLSKRHNKMAGPLVKTIALYKDDESSEGNATKDKAINVQDFLKEKRIAVRNDNGNEAKRKK